MASSIGRSFGHTPDDPETHASYVHSMTTTHPQPSPEVR